MRPLIQWVRENVALSFFFSTQIISLLLGFALLINSFVQDHKAHTTSPSTNARRLEQDSLNDQVERDVVFQKSPPRSSRVLPKNG